MPTSTHPFPPAWLWLIDETVPAWVKSKYSPQESWKDKPFSKDDSRFFFKGIAELSEIFTETRSKALQTYFLHPKFRSAYLLYFLPLQAAKFLTAFHLHDAAMEAALEDARKKGVLRVADLGAGPGTASLALLLWLLRKPVQDIPARVELEWFDTQKAIMDDGKGLAESLAASFPKLRGKLTVRTHVEPWWNMPKVLKEDVSLTLAGHVMNEASGHHLDPIETWSKILSRSNGGGVLMIEPAAKGPSQGLSRTRDKIFEAELLKRDASSIWGPCLHAEACPLADGRDWCHFSVPADIPGKWFKEFSKALSSERHWVKFSYLWLASPDYPAPIPAANLRRVISDPIGEGRYAEVLLCEPEQAGRLAIGLGDKLWRGDIVKKPGPVI